MALVVAWRTTNLIECGYNFRPTIHVITVKFFLRFLRFLNRKNVTFYVFTMRRSALHGLCDSNSVCLSVCLSVTLVDCVHTVRPTIMISSPYGSPIILVSDITPIPKFEGANEGVE